jgi:mono/diheme cytochrome c family protein
MAFPRHRVSLGMFLAFLLTAQPGAEGQSDHTHPPRTPAHDHGTVPIRITMEDLHRHGGVPPGWRLRVPPGDPKEGREVFSKLECFTCHAVKGGGFPPASKERDDVGPELTGMGSHHPAEYFAEAIMNPNAVIVTGAGHTGPDGLSRMPDYAEVLTVRELIDLVAYLGSLKDAHPPMPSHGGAPGGHHHRGAHPGAPSSKP